MIAHRGYSSVYLENTALAFEKAAEHHSGGAETDIRTTKDGVYVTNHNRDIIFEDGTSLTIKDSTFEELTNKPLLNNKTDDKLYLCTLERYLEIMRDNNMICFVELKDVFTDVQIKEIFGLVDRIYDLKKCILQSFEFDNLIRARNLFPELPLMLTYGTNEKNYERCFDYGFSLDIDHVAVTEKIIKEFHDRNLEVGVWTVDKQEDLEKCISLGVDYIESNVFGG